MSELIDRRIPGIMTDVPDVLLKVINGQKQDGRYDTTRNDAAKRGKSTIYAR